MGKNKNLLIIIAFAIFLFGVSVCYSQEKEEKIDKKITKYGAAEIQLGMQNVEEIARQYKFIDDPAYVDRVTSIGTRLAAVANAVQIDATYGSSVITPFNYEFRVVDSPDINAFSVMGGFIYINKGIIDFCESDDELAGIMAHEVIHAAHHHLVHLIDEQTKTNTNALLIMLAGILASQGNAEAIANVAVASNLYQIAIVNGYTQQAEKDSDRGALYLMEKAGFNPVGLLTPLERLSQKQDFVELGIYRSHPITKDRVMAVRNELKAENIPINRSKVSGKISLSYIVDETNPEKKIFKIYFEGKEILRVVNTDEAKARERVDQVISSLSIAMKNDLDFFDVKTSATDLIILNKSVLTVSDAEAALMETTTNNVVKNIYNIVRNVIMQRKQQTVI